jgi:hypothetical protein
MVKQPAVGTPVHCLRNLRNQTGSLLCGDEFCLFSTQNQSAKFPRHFGCFLLVEFIPAAANESIQTANRPCWQPGHEI